MTTFFYWSGVALWACVGLFVALVVGNLVMNGVKATIFVRRLHRVGGWKPGLSRSRKVKAFACNVWNIAIDPPYDGINFARGKHVAWPRIWPRRNREASNAD